ncbi:stress responsive A/B barrel domain protein [Xylariales sp. AK1849]|nr:stress responsive A/B barrel domain protein [Xylariales sp. AK1849]
MTIYHIVLFKFKALIPAEEVRAACDRMLALKTNCKHPESQQEYVKTSVGGANNSPEDAANGFTHAFVSQFENEEDRKYYLESDPAHIEFVKSIGDILDKHQVIDFTPGVF